LSVDAGDFALKFHPMIITFFW